MQFALGLAIALALAGSVPLDQAQSRLRNSRCPSYEDWSRYPHAPPSSGKLRLPLQRPPSECRTFSSPAVEQVLEEMKAKIGDPDIARLWENAFPNTLDTTIKFHRSGPNPLTFVVTGDIDAEWLRDSHRQLSPYLKVLQAMDADTREVDPLTDLIRGAIAQQARYVMRAPHCNAFQPPREAALPARSSNEGDNVWPYVSPLYSFECKYELDSLASFLGLSNDYYEATGDDSFVTHDWRTATAKLLRFVNRMTLGSFNETDGEKIPDAYRFQRWTNVGSETLPNGGVGNPTRFTGMARSWFRPSDDACIYQFFVPANAQMSVELMRVSKYFDAAGLGAFAHALSKQITEAIWTHGTTTHPVFGKVFAFEVDGFGSTLLMDDANLPSLLSLPDLGFVDKDDKTYQRTRKMITSMRGNPYYIKGEYFEGIGGPHVGVRAAWPMSRIVAMRTTDNVAEIREHMAAVMNSTMGLGLIHETVDVDTNQYSRPWFAWANSEFAKTIFDLEARGLLQKVTKDLI